MPKPKGRPKTVDRDATRWTVVLSRVHIETTILYVEASSEEVAVAKAIASDELEDAEWQESSFLDDYGYDVWGAYEPGTFNKRFTAERMRELLEETERYVLVNADLETGEGHVRLPPWFERQNQLMQADLVGDWTVAFDKLYAERGQDVHDSIDALMNSGVIQRLAAQPAQKQSAKVILLEESRRKRKEPPNDGDKDQ